MGIKDFFVPKWKHSSVAVRLKAIADNAVNSETLLDLAKNDGVSEVRIAAIKNIDDENVLSGIIEREKNEAVKEEAVIRRNALFEKKLATSVDPQTVLAIFEHYGNQKRIVAYLNEHSTEQSVQDGLVGKVHDPLLLSKITEHKCSVETGERIVSLLAEQEHLERIAKKASNKKVRQTAQNKVNTLFIEPLARQMAITKKLEQCINSMSIAVSLGTVDQAKAILDVANSVWIQYDAEKTHSLAPQFADAQRRLLEQIAAFSLQNENLKKLEGLSEQAAVLAQESLTKAIEELGSLQAQWDAVDISGLSGMVFDSAQHRFTEAIRLINDKKAQYDQEQNQIRLNTDALMVCCNDLEALIQSDNPYPAKAYAVILSRWRGLLEKKHSDTQGLQRFAVLQKKYDEKQSILAEQKEAAIGAEKEYLEHLVKRMETAAQVSIDRAGIIASDISVLKRKWESNYPLAASFKQALESRFAEAHRQFMVKLFEYKDQHAWQEWANEHIKAKICQDAEDLYAKLQHGNALTNLARKVHAFQNDWKRAGTKEQSTDLDKRFQDVCAHIFALGLAKKQELFDALTKTLETDLGSGAAEAVKQIQKQWNDIGYLPLELEKQLAESFYASCNSFFEQRKEAHQNYVLELQTNGVLREQICKESEVLSLSSAWKETITAFGNLQKRWEESWPAPLKRSRELWQVFSGHREQFFERYEAFKQGNVAEKIRLCECAESLLRRLEAPVALPAEESLVVADMPNTDESTGVSSVPPIEPTLVPAMNYAAVLSEIVSLQRAWKESGPVTKEESNKLWNRFRPVSDKIFAIVNEEQTRNRALKEAVVVESEVLAGSEEWDVAAQRFAALRELWKDIKPAARRDDQALWARLQAAGETFFSRRREHFEQKKVSTQQQLVAKKELCSELELLVRIAGKGNMLKTVDVSSSAEMLKRGIALRNELEVEGDAKKTAENLKHRAFAIMDKWEATQPAGGKEYFQLEKRYYDAIHLLRSR